MSQSKPSYTPTSFILRFYPRDAYARACARIHTRVNRTHIYRRKSHLNRISQIIDVLRYLPVNLPHIRPDVDFSSHAIGFLYVSRLG